MLYPLILNFLIGISLGFILELSYRSYEAKKFIIPKFINYQMYGLVGISLVLIHYLKVSLIYELLLLFIVPTLIEFITGYLYLKIKNIRLWNYQDELYNWKGLICLKFSFFWFIISAVYFYLILPLLI
jgi:uncharacterized membrane protein